MLMSRSMVILTRRMAIANWTCVSCHSLVAYAPGTIAVNVTWIERECLSNASQHVPIYLQPFLRYSKLFVENCDIFTPHLCLAAPQGVTPSEFREDLDKPKLEWIGYRVVKKAWQYIQPFWYSTSVWQTDGRMDGRPVYIYRVRHNKTIP